MFSVIHHYHFDAKNGAEIDGKIRESFVPLIKKAKSLSLIFRNLEALTLAPTFNESEPEGPTAGWVYGAVSLTWLCRGDFEEFSCRSLCRT